MEAPWNIIQPDLSPDSEKDLIVTMDQLLVQVNAGRTKGPRTRHELIYVRTGAQRGTNHSHGSRLIECYRQVMAVTGGRRRE